VTSEPACRLACEIENEFLCRSFLYRGPPVGTAYNCQLFHLDHKTLPDGPSTYLNAERPLIDNGERVGTYYENICESMYTNHHVQFNCYYSSEDTDTMLIIAVFFIPALQFGNSLFLSTGEKNRTVGLLATAQ